MVCLPGSYYLYVPLLASKRRAAVGNDLRLTNEKEVAMLGRLGNLLLDDGSFSQQEEN